MSSSLPATDIYICICIPICEKKKNLLKTTFTLLVIVANTNHCTFAQNVDVNYYARNPTYSNLVIPILIALYLKKGNKIYYLQFPLELLP